jgi:hypothetical protein
VTDVQGRRRFGGHSLRVTGAKYLAGIGLELFKLAILARWSSPVILRYIGEAPMGRITADVRKLIIDDQLQDMLQELQSTVKASEESVSLMSAIVEECQSKADEENRSLGERPQYVQNEVSGVWHRVQCMHPLVPMSAWRTRCGWLFASKAYKVAKELPDIALLSQLCERCLTSARAQLAEGQHDATD